MSHYFYSMGTSQACHNLETSRERNHISLPIVSGKQEFRDSLLQFKENCAQTTNCKDESMSVCHSNSKTFEEGLKVNYTSSCELIDSVPADKQNTSTVSHQKMPDTLSLASSSSTSSLSSSSSASVILDPGKKQHLSHTGAASVKVFGPASKNEHSRSNSQLQPRIRRVPSTANPKYRVPNLSKNQRSKSQPQIHIHAMESQRRNSSPPQLIANVHNVVTNVKTPQSSTTNQIYQTAEQFLSPQNLHQNSLQPHSYSAEQQQIIYLQIPRPTESQMNDPQILQQQISSQLQLLVPQIYSHLLNGVSDGFISSPSAMSTNEKQSSPKASGEQIYPNFTTDVQNQKLINQILDQNSVNLTTAPGTKLSAPQVKKPTNPSSKNLVEKFSETDNISKYFQIENISNILQQIPAHILHNNQLSSQTSYIEIQHLPGYPRITIPITRELLAQCHQNQYQQRDLSFIPYQPRLETILEESLSVKHLSMNNFPKTKIIACILTILCVVVVVLLAGDKTIAVVVVAVIFIIFLLVSVFYLYVNSSKNDVESPSISPSDSQRFQVSTISSCDKLSVV